MCDWKQLQMLIIAKFGINLILDRSSPWRTGFLKEDRPVLGSRRWNNDQSPTNQSIYSLIIHLRLHTAIIKIVDVQLSKSLYFRNVGLHKFLKQHERMCFTWFQKHIRHSTINVVKPWFILGQCKWWAQLKYCEKSEV